MKNEADLAGKPLEVVVHDGPSPSQIKETKKLWTYLEIIVKSYLRPTSFIKMTSGTVSFKFNIETNFCD